MFPRSILKVSCFNLNLIRHHYRSDTKADKIKNLFDQCKSLLNLNQIDKNKNPSVSIGNQIKRIKRLKTNNVTLRPGQFNVVAYATAEEYDLRNLALALKTQDLYLPSELTNDELLQSGLGPALHAVAKYKLTPENRHIFFFQEGAVVIWNCGEIEQHAIVDFLKPFEIKKYDTDVVLAEIEQMSYVYEANKKKTSFDNGVMHIAALNKTPEDIGGDRYTLSNAMALSVKLGILETLLTKYAQTIEPITQELRFGRPVSISKSGVLRKSGELFSLRHSINLSTEFLDIPDFYWDRENLEELYQLSCSYYSITRRTKVLNEKLNHCAELIHLISSHLSDRHHIRLEWMIIILIMVEVGFEVLHYVNESVY